MQWSIVNPETQNRRLELTCPVKPCKTRGFPSTGPGVAHKRAAGPVLRWVRNRTDSFLPYKSGSLAGYPDLLLTVDFCGSLPLLCWHLILTYHTSIIELIVACCTHNLPARESEAPRLCPRLSQSDAPCLGRDCSLRPWSTWAVPILTMGRAGSPGYLHIGYRLPDTSVASMQLMCLVPLSSVY